MRKESSAVESDASQQISAPTASKGLKSAVANSFQQELRLLQTLVNSSLASVFEDRNIPQPLHDAMRYSLLAGGKRLRPILVLLAAKACQADIQQALPAACAVEMVHTYSLIHDDLPAMDDDDLRRGKPTNHIVFGEANAILAGDALLTYAFELIATQITPGEVSARCIAALAKGAGPEGMVAGQVLDLAAEQHPVTEPTELENIHRCKTGKLIAASLQMGGIIGGATPLQLTHLEKYGHYIGLAFQIMDDILDCVGHADTMGKHVRKDANLGKATYPQLLGLEKSQTLADNLVSQAKDELKTFGENALDLIHLADYLRNRDH